MFHVFWETDQKCKHTFFAAHSKYCKAINLFDFDIAYFLESVSSTADVFCGEQSLCVCVDGR